MIALLRLAVFLFVILTATYFLVSIYSRSVRREKLEKQWEAEPGPGDRDAFIRAGMESYERSLRKKLIWLVYVIPITIVLVLLYVTNFM